MQDPAEIRKSFERAGVTSIRAQLESISASSNKAFPEWHMEALKWLAEKDAEVASAESAKRDAREAETLRIAKRANTIAYIAAAIAAASIIKDILVEVFK